MVKKKKDVFSIGELVVYPKHGVGEIKSISTIVYSLISQSLSVDAGSPSTVCWIFPVRRTNIRCEFLVVFVVRL